MVYGLIIAAGKQSRFESSTPKALMPYGESTLLDINIENMQATCDMVFVVVSFENYEWFNNCTRIIIESGKGCGDAVMQALEMMDLEEDDTVFIQWGDCLHTKQIYQDLRNEYSRNCCGVLIPCVYEEKPYVQIIPTYDSKIHVSFSKYDEPITAGYHDLSLFYGNAIELRTHLIKFAESIKSAVFDNCYKHKHGNEMQFLDVFNETDLKGRIIEYSDYTAFAFNTVEEFNKLVNS